MLASHKRNAVLWEIRGIPIHYKSLLHAIACKGKVFLHRRRRFRTPVRAETIKMQSN